MKTLLELKNEILADGIIDANEVKELESVLFADGIIDTDEAILLFELNNAVSGKSNDNSWSDLFIKAISSYVLDDDNSNGEIDEQEAKWLYDNIKGDVQIDETERKLLKHLKEKSINFPEILNELL